MIFGASTNKGCIRVLNEDSYYVQTEEALIQFALVADGMGGHNAGEVASGMVSESIAQMLNKKREFFNLKLMRESIEAANRTVFDAASQRQDYTGMGTTVTLAILAEDEISVANVGDSRAYHYDNRKRRLTQITRDHSLAEELIAAGRLKKEELENYTYRNVITRAMGTSAKVSPDIFVQPWNNCDMLLLCTDGLIIHLDADEIKAVLKKRISAQQMCEMLVEKTINCGGKDNVTVIIVKNSDKEVQ